jgi:Fur family peroxide stress response transcriptional regulator
MATRRIHEEEVAVYERRLREAGQFLTVQRRAILHYLIRHRVHPTTTQIARAVLRSNSASQATVYNNLNLFAQLELVRAVRSPHEGGDTRWDLRTDAHHHISCTECGQVLDIEPSAAEVLVHDLSLARRVVQSQAWFTGVCEACSAKSDN